MKREISSELIKEYLNGEDAAEEEFYARYDRDLVVTAELWAGIESQIVPVGQPGFGWWMGIAAVLVLSIGLGFTVLLTRTKDDFIAALTLPEETAPVIQQRPVESKTRTIIKPIKKPMDADNRRVRADNPGVLSADLGALDLDDEDTAKHIEQTENLLRSIRNVSVSDSDDEVDVSYDKALSRRLLIENVVLRREAEMKAKFPTKTLLADLEPLLIDIANLPDRAKPEDVRAIKERVQKTEIVAALVDLSGTRRR